MKTRNLSEIFDIYRSKGPHNDTLVAIRKTVSENFYKNFSALIHQSDKIL
jgi:hypothetical protein